MIVASAPGRAGILGNPSDMYGGTVISCAVRQRAYVAVEPAPGLRLTALDADLSVEVRSGADLRLVKPPTSAETVRMTPTELAEARRRTYLNVLKAVVSHQRMASEPVHIRCWSEVPPNAGLSSSSALLVAALHATDRYLGRESSRHRFAETARSIEYTRMGVTCGFQDFYATSFGGLLYMDFRDKQDWRGPDADPFATVEQLVPGVERLPFVLAHTGTQRDSGETHRPLRSRWLDGEPAVTHAVGEAGRLARHGKRHLLDGDWEALAALMQHNHELIAGIGGSGPACEELIATAQGLGARAAKLAGAGQGGTIVALHDDPVALAERLKAAGATAAFPLVSAAPGVRLEALAAADVPLPGVRVRQAGRR